MLLIVKELRKCVFITKNNQGYFHHGIVSLSGCISRVLDVWKGEESNSHESMSKEEVI